MFITYIKWCEDWLLLKLTQQGLTRCFKKNTRTLKIGLFKTWVTRSKLQSIIDWWRNPLFYSSRIMHVIWWEMVHIIRQLMIAQSLVNVNFNTNGLVSLMTLVKKLLSFPTTLIYWMRKMLFPTSTKWDYHISNSHWLIGSFQSNVQRKAEL